MQDKSKTEKAYNNLKFLNSSEARTIRILSEYYEPKARFEENNIVDTIVFFGSARIRARRETMKELKELKKTKASKAKIEQAEKQVAMSRYYEDAVELSARLTKWSQELPMEENRFIICSGGGPGIMEAANKGAKKAGGPSLGLNISIPFEQFVNKYVKKDLSFEFHYFFMRKFWFVYPAKALIIFPGGFGTLDELMEVLTLIQTGKIKKEMKVIVYDEAYWKKVINFDALVEFGTISRKDLEIFDFCSTVDEVFEKTTKHLKRHYLSNGYLTL